MKKRERRKSENSSLDDDERKILEMMINIFDSSLEN
jgi:hypothetical protein